MAADLGESRRKLKRASGLIRDAIGNLAAVEEDVLGDFTVETDTDVAAVAAAVEVARAQRGPLHVQIVAAPTRR